MKKPIPILLFSEKAAERRGRSREESNRGDIKEK
jgi:hypothetical protein